MLETQQVTNVVALSTEETNYALFLWIYDCQQTSFTQEYKQLKSKPAKRSSLVRQLHLFLDADGYIRCGGRIHNAPLSELTRLPFLLPSKHLLTEHDSYQPTPWRSKECHYSYSTKILDTCNLKGGEKPT